MHYSLKSRTLSSAHMHILVCVTSVQCGVRETFFFLVGGSRVRWDISPQLWQIGHSFQAHFPAFSVFLCAQLSTAVPAASIVFPSCDWDRAFRSYHRSQVHDWNQINWSVRCTLWLKCADRCHSVRFTLECGVDLKALWGREQDRRLSGDYFCLKVLKTFLKVIFAWRVMKK